MDVSSGRNGHALVEQNPKESSTESRTNAKDTADTESTPEMQREMHC